MFYAQDFSYSRFFDFGPKMRFFAPITSNKRTQEQPVRTPRQVSISTTFCILMYFVKTFFDFFLPMRVSYDMQEARDILLRTDAESEPKWRQLSEKALKQYDLVLAQECAARAKDVGLLLLLHSSTGNREVSYYTVRYLRQAIFILCIKSGILLVDTWAYLSAQSRMSDLLNTARRRSRSTTSCSRRSAPNARRTPDSCC